MAGLKLQKFSLCFLGALLLFTAATLHAQLTPLAVASILPGQTDAETNKANAYIEAANFLLMHPHGNFGEDLKEESTAPWTDIPEAVVPIFKHAMALPGRVPELDLAAEDYVDALEKVLPWMKQRNEFLALSRAEQMKSSFSEKYTQSLKDADKAQQDFSRAVNRRVRNAEEHYISGTDQRSSFPYLWVLTGLHVRSIVEGQEEDEFSYLVSANNQLSTFMKTPAYQKMHLPASCQRAADMTNKMITSYRTLSLGSGAGLDPQSVRRHFLDTYGVAIMARNDCNLGR